MNGVSLLPSERITFALRSLYDAYGYSRYKMTKFEEYDLYARNKDFLISENVITFTDVDGKLMALKPDVTLSIVKNTRDMPDTVQKLYYNENVYRVRKGSRSFQEIMQVGLEAMGNVDTYCIFEVLLLAARSLACTGKCCVLEVSHMGILADVISYLGFPQAEKNTLLGLLGEKNRHEVKDLCRKLEIPVQKAAVLEALMALSGTPETVLPELNALLAGIAGADTLASFTQIMTQLEKASGIPLHIDFSAVGDPRYYNGFVFKGFAEHIPSAILSGGQYDTMMREMKRSDSAIGFAVYLDLLEQYSVRSGQFDVDTLLLYDDSFPLEAILKQAEARVRTGKTVRTERRIPEGLQYRELLVMKNGKVEVAKHA